MQEHFSKFTDATGEIIWQKDEETGKETAVACGCRAVDGELVMYPESFFCEGQVEHSIAQHGIAQHSTA